MGPVNRASGIVFGFVRGVFLVGLFVLMARHTVIVDDPWWKVSVLLPRFTPVANTISELIPDRVHHISRLLSDEQLKT